MGTSSTGTRTNHPRRAHVARRAHRMESRRRAENALAALRALDAKGITIERLAELLGVSERSIHRWWHEESAPQPSHADRLHKLAFAPVVNGG